MDELLATLRNWYRGLAQREQYAVIAGAAACLAVLLLAAWIPVERRVSHLEQSVRTKQADLAWLQSVGPQLGALRSAASVSGGQSLVVHRRSGGARYRDCPFRGRQPAGG